MIREILSKSTWAEIITDTIGVICLFTLGFASLWIMPIISEILK